MPLKLLIGPEVQTAGSHYHVSQIPGMHTFTRAGDLLAAVAAVKPDAVVLRAAGHNGVSPADIAACPVPVIGLYHDWPCWTSIRLEAVAAMYDWLITEKSAAGYLQTRTILNKSAYLMMSREGVERVAASGVQASDARPIDVCFLGSYFTNGFRNPYRLRDTDPTAAVDNLYWSRLGFRERSTLIAQLAAYPANTYIAAETRPRADVTLDAREPSFSVLAQSKICVHIDAGRQYAANRCFEAMALGCLLFLEEGNELFDYLPPGHAVAYTAQTLQTKLDHYLANPQQARAIAAAGQAYAKKEFTNEKLAKGLGTFIESVLPALRHKPKHRGNLWPHYRAPVHWAGAAVQLGNETVSNLAHVHDTWLGLNEALVFWFDVWQKMNDQNALTNALTSMKRAHAMLPPSPVFYWNMAVLAATLKQAPLMAEALRLMDETLKNPNADYSGSRLEIQQDWWLSGHIEHALAIAKIGNADPMLERNAMRYRLGMLRGDREIHWPDLPDEHKRNGDLAKVRALDPLDDPAPELAEHIEDLKAETPAARASA